jgi:hypothetical protein
MVIIIIIKIIITAHLVKGILMFLSLILELKIVI